MLGCNILHIHVNNVYAYTSSIICIISVVYIVYDICIHKYIVYIYTQTLVLEM